MPANNVGGVHAPSGLGPYEERTGNGVELVDNGVGTTYNNPNTPETPGALVALGPGGIGSSGTRSGSTMNSVKYG